MLSAGGSVPAHLPAREGPPSASHAGQTVFARKQQERQRRGILPHNIVIKRKSVLYNLLVQMVGGNFFNFFELFCRVH